MTNVDHPAIRAYLASLRQALGPLRAPRLLSEVEDHLLEGTADHVKQGLSAEAAEARAIERFGSAEALARQYVADLAAGSSHRVVFASRLVATGVALLTVYYARFFLLVRHETSTLVQIGVLLAAALVLSVPVRALPSGGSWFHNWRPVSIEGWTSVVVGLAVAVAFFVWADHDSHSASDTLNRAVPGLCLIVSALVRLILQGNRPRLPGSIY